MHRENYLVFVSFQNHLMFTILLLKNKRVIFANNEYYIVFSDVCRYLCAPLFPNIICRASKDYERKIRSRDFILFSRVLVCLCNGCRMLNLFTSAILKYLHFRERMTPNIYPFPKRGPIIIKHMCAVLLPRNSKHTIYTPKIFYFCNERKHAPSSWREHMMSVFYVSNIITFFFLCFCFFYSQRGLKVTIFQLK